MSKSKYPQTVYVTLETNGDGTPYLLAFNDPSEAADGRDGDKIAVYRFDHVTTAVDRPCVKKDQ